MFDDVTRPSAKWAYNYSILTVTVTCSINTCNGGYVAVQGDKPFLDSKGESIFIILQSVTYNVHEHLGKTIILDSCSMVL